MYVTILEYYVIHVLSSNTVKFEGIAIFSDVLECQEDKIIIGR